MRKIKYHCAMSLDGYVARKDGSWDGFLMHGPHVADFVRSIPQHDVALLGRKTYEVGLKQGVKNPYPTLKTYVFSRTLLASPDPNVTLVGNGAFDVVRGLKARDGKDIWLVGAGELAATLMAHDLVDEVSVKLNPIMLGEGISVVAHLPHLVRFQLVESRPYDNGVVLLTYRVLPSGR